MELLYTDGRSVNVVTVKTSVMALRKFKHGITINPSDLTLEMKRSP